MVAFSERTAAAGYGQEMLLPQLSWDAIKRGRPELPKVVALNEIGLKRLQRDQGFTALRSGADL